MRRKVVTIFQPATNVPRSVPDTFDTPPVRQRWATGISRTRKFWPWRPSSAFRGSSRRSFPPCRGFARVSRRIARNGHISVYFGPHRVQSHEKTRQMPGENLLRVHAAGFAFAAGARTNDEILRAVRHRGDQLCPSMLARRCRRRRGTGGFRTPGRRPRHPPHMPGRSRVRAGTHDACASSGGAFGGAVGAAVVDDEHFPWECPWRGIRAPRRRRDPPR